MYSGQRRKQGLNYQSMKALGGLVLHYFASVEERRHGWILYTKSNLDEILHSASSVESNQHSLLTDFGYSKRWFLEVRYEESCLSAVQKKYQALTSSRITIG